MAATQKPARSAKVQIIGLDTILWLTVGKLTTAYRVVRLNGTAYQLDKADQGDGKPETYRVRLDGSRSHCDCQGFQRYGMCRDARGCKHIAGLEISISRGRI